jgi:hypothetical protein
MLLKLDFFVKEFPMIRFNAFGTILFFQLSTLLYAFPGEHNSLTCDQNFLGLSTTIDNVPNTILTDVNIKIPNSTVEIPNTGILGKYYRRAADGLGSDPNVAANYANIVSAINSDIALPNSIVRDKLRHNHNFALHATIWGIVSAILLIFME